METLSQLVAFTFLGLIVSILISLYFLRGNKPLIAFILCLGGMFAGLLGAMTYIFFTGGLEESPFMSLPSLILAFLTCFILMKYFGVKIELKRGKKKPFISTPMTTLLIFFILITVLLLTMFPIETTGLTSTQEVREPYGLKVSGDGYMIKDTSVTSITALGQFSDGNIRCTGIELADVAFPHIMADPQPGQYISFTAHFAVASNSWVAPYVKILVFKDVNANSVLDTGDTIWYTDDYKISTGASPDNSNWRSQVMYSGGSPLLQLNWATSGSSPLFMPIFLATNWGTVWMNDANKAFQNTPEGYTSPRDQMSWDYDSNAGTIMQKEAGAITFVQVAAGSSVDLTGKLYCAQENTGTNCMIIQAYDANQASNNNPYATQTPLASYPKAFTISGGGPGPGAPVITITVATWSILGILGVGTTVGAVVAASKYKALLLTL
jgi:hypothetical protein